MLEQLLAHCHTLETDSEIRVVLLTSASEKAFCVGADIHRWTSLSALDMWRNWIRRGHQAFDALAQLPQPVIALLHGLAYGGGLELAATADIRICSAEAQMALPETGLAFVINFFIMMPPVADLLAGFIPSVPDPVAGDNSTPFLIISGMVGTTVAPAMFLMRTTLVKSNGWGVDNLPHQNRDAIVSAGMMFIISAAVMAAAAGTLYQTGTGLNNASQMVIILEPIAGSAAVGLFVIGIVAAGLSSQFPNLLLTPWLLADWRDTSNEVSPGYRILMTVMSLLCLVVPLFHARPVLVMIASQAFNAIILPLTVLCMFWLANKPSLMGKYRCSRWENVMFIAISVFTLIMGYMAMSGLIESLMK